jgi:hypothetical protein
MHGPLARGYSLGSRHQHVTRLAGYQHFGTRPHMRVGQQQSSIHSLSSYNGAG